jgi:hypothetical protein
MASFARKVDRMTDDAHPHPVQPNSIFRLVRSRLNSGAWTLVVLVVIEVLTNFLSADLTIARFAPDGTAVSRRTFYDGWVGLIIVCLLVAAVLWTLNNVRRLRLAFFIINSLYTAQLFMAAILIVVRLLQSTKITAAKLIVDALVIFGTNILIFTLWYWFIDSAKTRYFKVTDDPRWDFLFPQRQAVYPGYEDWKPHASDYLFLAYTTSVAFSPTDTLPLSRAAKLLMLTQSAISLITITVVAGTAINILAGNA